MSKSPRSEDPGWGGGEKKEKKKRNPHGIEEREGLQEDQEIC